MDQDLDSMYLEWLYEQVGLKGPSNRTHWGLLRQMLSKEFVWIVPNDDNRVEDGRELRYEFVKAARLRRVRGSWMGMGCSFLEMLIGLSRRLSFEADGEPPEWFWILISNLRLSKYDDNYYEPENIHKFMNIDRKMEKVIWRTYDYTGNGGLFPLANPEENQTEVEIWYQMNAYLLERY